MKEIISRNYVCQRKIVYNITQIQCTHIPVISIIIITNSFFIFFFATRIIIVACSISEKKLQCATTTLEKNTKRYFMSFSTLRIRNIAKAEWTLPHLGNLVKGVTFVDHQARRQYICLIKKRKLNSNLIQQIIELY